MFTTQITQLRIPEVYEELDEFSLYVQNPSPATFATIHQFAINSRSLQDLAKALIVQYSKTPNWKIAQHLALIFVGTRSPTLSTYYSQKAMEGSDGDVKARLVYTKSLWVRKIPGAVFFQESIIRAQLRRMTNRQLKLSLQMQFNDLLIQCYTYIRQFTTVRKLILYFHSLGRFPSEESALQIMNSANTETENDLILYASRILAPGYEHFGKRIQVRILNGIRSQFLALLKRNASRG